MDKQKQLAKLLAQAVAKELAPYLSNHRLYHTPESLGATLGVTPKTVRKWCNEGGLPHARVGNQIYIKSSDHEVWMDAKRIRKTPELSIKQEAARLLEEVSK